MNPYTKIQSPRHEGVYLKVIPGHFVTPNSHINSYIDMTTMKSRQSEARASAKALAESYVRGTVVDTIVCMDNTEVIGAYLAEELTENGVENKNLHRTMYVLTPEYDTYGQMIFRDNTRIMLQDKHVLLLLASTTTGRTMKSAMKAIRVHGGEVVGVSAIFSTMTEVDGVAVHALYSGADLPAYESHLADECKMCESGIPVDAICNGFGYTEVNR